MNLLSTLNKKNYTLRRSARLLATQASQGIIDAGGGEFLNESRGIQTSKRKCSANNDTSVAINPEDDLKKKRILGKEHVDPDHEDTRPSKRKRGPYLEPVYIIPDYERKKTTFKGRLG